MATATSETVMTDAPASQATQLDEVLQAVEGSLFIDADELADAGQAEQQEAARLGELGDVAAAEQAVIEQVVVDDADAEQQVVAEQELGQLADAGEVATVQTLEMKPIEMMQAPQINDAAQASMLGPIPMEHGLILAGIIFAIGLCGVMVRRNFLFMLMSLEIMMSAAGLAFIVAGSHWLSADGQIMFIFILTLAAAEASLGLAILLQFYHRRGHLDVDTANEMRG